MPLSCERTSKVSCWSCSKRRVRCDSVKPTCRRCPADGLECPGYAKPLTWMGGPTRPRKANKPETHKTGEDYVSQRVQRPQDSRALLTPRDRMNQSLAETFDYWNSHVMRDNMPAHAPFKRLHHTMDKYMTSPDVLQHLLFVTMRTVQLGKAGGDPRNDQTLCYRRGLAYRDLQALLPKSNADTAPLVLTATIAALLADFGLSETNAWNYHLEASRKVISCNGGFKKCLEDQPAMKELLANVFMVLDIFSATFEPSNNLSLERLEMQMTYLPLLPGLGVQLLLNTDACPQEVFQHIIRITALRCRIDERGSSWSVSVLTAVLLQITAFDEQVWAKQAVRYGLVHPQRSLDVPTLEVLSAWSTLGACYKHATFLYLSSSFPWFSISRSNTVSTVDAHTALADRIETLFDLASTDPDAPTEGQLYKLVNWPLLISLKCNADRTTLCADIAVQKDLTRLELVAASTGVRSWLSLGQHLVELAVRDQELD